MRGALSDCVHEQVAKRGPVSRAAGMDCECPLYSLLATVNLDKHSIRRADTGMDCRYPFLIELSKSPASIAQSNKQWVGLKKKRLQGKSLKAFFMPLAGLEPARCYPLDFESSASANSATVAYAFARETSYHTLETDARSFCKSTWKMHLIL